MFNSNVFEQETLALQRKSIAFVYIHFIRMTDTWTNSIGSTLYVSNFEAFKKIVSRRLSK